MTPGQCRAARGLVHMSQAALARAAVVDRGTVLDFESGARTLQQASRDAIKRALETVGVEFTDGRRPGVRLRKGGK
jgi:DNA-binding transcriptional regulator YiaG